MHAAAGEERMAAAAMHAHAPAELLSRCMPSSCFASHPCVPKPLTLSTLDGHKQTVSKDNGYKGHIYMVFDYAKHDLTGLAERVKKFNLPQVWVCVGGGGCVCVGWVPFQEWHMAVEWAVVQVSWAVWWH